MRYAPNQTPDNVPNSDFFGAEFYRIKESLRNLEVDNITVYKASPAQVAFTLGDNGLIFRDTAGANPIIEFFNNLAVRTGYLKIANTVATLEQENGNSGTVSLYAKDAAGVRKELSWLPAGGTSGGLIQSLGKNIFETGDAAWLYINRTSAFSSGVTTPLIMRADGGFNMALNAGRLRLGATRGSINTNDAVGGWYGYQCNARVAFLHDGASAFSIFDMVNTKTLFAATLAAESSMYHNNVQTIKTAVSNALVFDGTVFRKAIYDTGQITISAAVTGSVAHGLGYTPGSVHYFLECTTADGGYAIGDRLAIPVTISTATAAGCMAWCNATSIGYSRSSVIHAGNLTTGIVFVLTLTSWRFRAIVAF